MLELTEGLGRPEPFAHKLERLFEEDVIVGLFGELVVGSGHQLQLLNLRLGLVPPGLARLIADDEFFLGEHH